MACHQVTDGEDGLQLWKAAVNVLNKESLKLTKGGPPAWGLGVGLQLLTIKISLLLGQILWINDLS
jgi:hypothetical protein